LKIISISRILIYSITSLGCFIIVLGLFSPATFASSTCYGTTNACYGLSLSVSPGSGPAGGTFTVTTSWTGPQSGVPQEGNNLYWIVVNTPSGNSYICGTASSEYCFSTLTLPSSPVPNSATLTCNIPYGGPGTLSGSYSGGSAAGYKPGVKACDSGASQPVWYQSSSSLSLAALESYCSGSSSFPSTTGSTLDGSTTSGGTYTAYACWFSSGGPGGLVSNTFSALPSSTVPEFPIGASVGLLLVVGLVIPLMLLLKIKFLQSGRRSFLREMKSA